MKDVAIPIETKNRELDGKLWLTLHLINRGHQVVLGHEPEIYQWVDGLAPDVFIAVGPGGYPWMRHLYRDLQNEDVYVFALDVEGGIIRRDEEYLVRVSPRILEHVDKYLAWGPTLGELITDHTPFPQNNVKVTGNPRFDLLHADYRDFYQPGADRLVKEYGEYLLVTTNFGLVNHYDKEGNRELRERDDVLRMKKPTDELKFEPIAQDLLEEFLDAVPHLSEAFPDHTIVVRPHPSEDHSTYRDAFEELDDVVTEHSGPVSEWILGADALVHNNSTVGVEGVLLDQPTFAFCPVEDPEYELILPNTISRKATSYDELESGIAKVIDTESPGRELDQDQRDLLESYFHNTDGRGAERVTAVIDEAEHVETWTNGTFDVSTKKRLKRTLKRFGVHHPYHALLRLLTDRNPRSGYTEQKFPGIERAELREKIANMKQLDDRFAGLEVTVEPSTLANDCYWLSTD